MKKKCVLACAICGSRNYVTDTQTERKERLELNKFCKKCNVHCLHRETK